MIVGKLRMDNPNTAVFPGGSVIKELACQCRRSKRCRFNPWFGEIPWRRAWQPTSVFLPEKSHGQRSLEGYSQKTSLLFWDVERLVFVLCGEVVGWWWKLKNDPEPSQP